MTTYLEVIKATRKFLDKPFVKNHKRMSRRRMKAKHKIRMKILESPYFFEYNSGNDFIYF